MQLSQDESGLAAEAGEGENVLEGGVIGGDVQVPSVGGNVSVSLREQEKASWIQSWAPMGTDVAYSVGTRAQRNCFTINDRA